MLAAATVFYVSPWLPVSVPALLCTFGLALVDPIFSLALVPAFAPFFMVPKQLHGSLQPAPQEVFLAVSLAALVIRSLVAPICKPDWNALRRSPFLFPAALLLVGAAIAALLSVSQERHLAFRAFYQVVLEPLIYFSALLLFMRRPRDWYVLLGVFVAAGAVVCWIGLGQYVTGQGLSIGPGSSLRRVEGPYGSPDNLGLLLDRATPLWLAPIFFGALAGRVRLLWIIGGASILPVLVLTFSRGAWLAVAVAVLGFLILQPGWPRRLALAVLGVSVLAAVVATPVVVNALRAGHAHTVERRLAMWRSSVRMIRDRPITGIGPDNFQYYYAPRHNQQLYSPCWGLGYLEEPTASDEPCRSHPHNEVLDFYLSSGPLGLAAFVWAECVFWLAVLRAPVARLEPLPRAVILGAAGAMLAALLHGFVDNSYFLMDLSILFWLLCALVQFCAVDRGEVAAV